MKTSPFLAIVAITCAVVLAQEAPETGAPAANEETGLAEAERLVNLGNEAYSREEYEAAIELFGQAVEINPWYLDAGTRQILALLRSALAQDDRGATFDNVVAAFEYVKGGALPEDLAAEAEVLQEILDNLPAEDRARPRDAVAEAPVLVTEVAPVYPSKAQRLRIQGDVRVRLLVGIDGAVKDIRIEEVPRNGVGFEEAVTAAVQRWRFQPATENGRPVSAWVTIRVPFRAR